MLRYIYSGYTALENVFYHFFSTFHDAVLSFLDSIVIVCESELIKESWDSCTCAVYIPKIE